MVVDITVCVSLRWLLLVDNPVLVVHDVLVGVLAAGQVASDEPLVGVVIELQFVALLPIIKAAANVNALVTWAPVVQPKGVRSSLVYSPIKLRGYNTAIIRRLASLCTDVHVVKLVLSSIFRANDFVNDVLRPVLSGVPVFEERLGRIHLLDIDVNLVTQAAELIKPCDTHLFSWHGGIESVLTQSQILLLVSVRANSAFNGKDEIFLVISLEREATADLAVPHVLNDTIFEAACFKGDDRCGAYKELVLDNTTWLEKRWHEAEISTTVYK